MRTRDGLDWLFDLPFWLYFPIAIILTGLIVPIVAVCFALGAGISGGVIYGLGHLLGVWG